MFLKCLGSSFRYQRLVPGRENIAAEHLVPQLGYVSTSKHEWKQTGHSAVSAVVKAEAKSKQSI